ncbi:lipopolysaccharide assembly protein LapA domain-containing protein [Actinomycetospora sp. NBC_00405]|uniref:lipopolysaccharide assembly protein LapA domain-containing protein n=1 Tax=Actinomycetospora sp. NBC_00405 TaxID=2975952 RepID=UPI002E212AEC
MVQQHSGATAGGSAGARRGGARLGAGAIASLVGVGLLVIFMIQNTDRITLTFLFWSFTWPLWLFTVVTALVGALIWFGLGVMRRHRRRTERRAERRD